MMSLQIAALSDCNRLQGCERKLCEIEMQLMAAKEKNNKHRISGLTRSLENARKNCTDKSLRGDLNEKLEEARSDMAGYEIDFKAAKSEGKVDKILKYQNKIEEEKVKIRYLEDELSDLDQQR